MALSDGRRRNARGAAVTWTLLAAAAVALGGCFERHEQANPFVGPSGAGEEEPFGVLVPAADASTLAVVPGTAAVQR